MTGRPARGRREHGAAVVDFVLVSGLLSFLFVAVLQLGLALHVRNTLVSCASEGARVGARSGAAPGDGIARTQSMITTSLSGRFAEDVTADVQTVGGVEVVVVRVRAPVPVIGLIGTGQAFDVVGRSFREDQ